MTTSFTEKYQHIYQLNTTLLILAREGAWDEFILAAERYIIMLSEVLEANIEDFSPMDRENINVILQRLIDNEVEIDHTMKNRLEVIKKEIAVLQRGKKCSQAYAAPFSSTSH